MTKKTPHHNKGNTYASKENPSSVRIPVMATVQQSAKYRLAGGDNRNQWIKDVLDAEIEKLGITDDNHEVWSQKHRF